MTDLYEKEKENITMRLFVDRGNLQGLKILISASIKGRSIELNVVNPAGKFTREKIL